MRFKTIIPALIALSLTGPALAEDDVRIMIDVPPESRVWLLGEMRVLIDNLDDLIAGLSEGDFKEVARIADYKLGFGHARFEKMLEDGVPEAEIEAARLKMMKRRKAGGGSGQGHGGGGGSIFGQGVGRLMPQEVREMGQQLHAAASDVSIAAKAAGDKPTVDDYKAVLEAVQQMTGTCRACHATFKIQ